MSSLREDGPEVRSSTYRAEVAWGSDGSGLDSAVVSHVSSEVRLVEAEPYSSPDDDGVTERQESDGRSKGDTEVGGSSREQLIRRVGKLLVDMEMVSEAPSQRASDEGVISSSKAGATPPPGTGQEDDRLITEWLDMFERLCFAGERALRRHRGSDRNTVLLSKEERSRRILAYPKQMSPTFVAFVEGVTESHVRQLRGKDRADRRREGGSE